MSIWSWTYILTHKRIGEKISKLSSYVLAQCPVGTGLSILVPNAQYRSVHIGMFENATRNTHVQWRHRSIFLHSPHSNKIKLNQNLLHYRANFLYAYFYYYFHYFRKITSRKLKRRENSFHVGNTAFYSTIEKTRWRHVWSHVTTYLKRPGDVINHINQDCSNYTSII